MEQGRGGDSGESRGPSLHDRHKLSGDLYPEGVLHHGGWATQLAVLGKQLPLELGRTAFYPLELCASLFRECM